MKPLPEPEYRKEAPVRFRDDEFEYQCPTCGYWWPLTREYWRPGSGMRRCVTCWREYKRLDEAIRRGDPGVRAVKNYKNRLRYLEKREERLAGCKRWREANKERKAAYQREWRARQKAKALEAAA